MTTTTATTWTVDEQQVSFVRTVFDLTVHGPITIGLEDLDPVASLNLGQNREEMELDDETVTIIRLYMDDGVTIPMPLVWAPNRKARRYVVLDGNHRIAAALRKRGEPTCEAVLVTGDSSIAQRLALIINTQHGRSTRTAEYTATAMRLLREQEVPVAQIARMFAVSIDAVYKMTRRDEQLERLRRLVPERRTRVPVHTLDLLGEVEDGHVRILGELFLDATKAQQEELVARLRSAPSADRDAIAHEVVGELREMDRIKRKVKAKTSRPSSRLADALQRLVGVPDANRAFYAAPDQQKAVMRQNLGIVLPRLTALWSHIGDVA